MALTGSLLCFLDRSAVICHLQLNLFLAQKGLKERGTPMKSLEVFFFVVSLLPPTYTV